MENPLWERNSFFKVMIGDYLTRLRIPPCFHRYLREEVMVIRSRGGREWAVILKREGESMFFENGWERFVADLAIQLGEFLIFVYDGNLGFDVKIYGITGCEKEDSNASVEKERQKMEEEDTAKTSSWPNCASTIAREVFNGRIILKGLTKFGNERALKSARSFKSSKPCFISTYSACRKKYMDLPRHILKEIDAVCASKTTLLDPCGRSWPVDVRQRADGRRFLGRGWRDFCKANQLQNGDICNFELICGIQTMNVQIHRPEL